MQLVAIGIVFVMDGIERTSIHLMTISHNGCRMPLHHVHGISITIQNKMKRRSRNFITCVWDGRHYGISVGAVNAMQNESLDKVIVNTGGND